MSKLKRQSVQNLASDSLKKDKKKVHLQLVQDVAADSDDDQPEDDGRKDKINKLLEFRKKMKDNGEMKKVPGRRGRKPKVENLEVDPDNRDEDSYVYESEEVSLEYDAGISVKKGKDEGFLIDPLDRIEEELNFDT